MADYPHTEIRPRQTHDRALRMKVTRSVKPFEAMTDSQSVGEPPPLLSLSRTRDVLVLGSGNAQTFDAVVHHHSNFPRHGVLDRNGKIGQDHAQGPSSNSAISSGSAP